MRRAAATGSGSRGDSLGESELGLLGAAPELRLVARHSADSSRTVGRCHIGLIKCGDMCAEQFRICRTTLRYLLILPPYFIVLSAPRTLYLLPLVFHVPFDLNGIP